MLKTTVSALAIVAAMAVPAHANSISCGAPVVDVGYSYDPDPVVSVEVSYDGPLHAWQIFHHRASGDVVPRAQQYAIVDRSNRNVTRWGGSLNRNRNLYMVGEVVSYQSGEAVYQEWLYDRGQGNRLDMHMTARCRWEYAQPAVVPVPVPMPVAPAPYIAPMPSAPAPVQQTGPTQQNGAIVAPPSNQTVIITIPGTTYSPIPKGEKDGGS